MSVMTTGHQDTPERRLTVDDLANTPDDGQRYELVDGRLDVSPAPQTKHFRSAHRLSTYLDNLCDGMFEIGEGVGLVLNSERTHHRIPDLALFDIEPPENGYSDIPPLLAVEIISPDSVFRDTHVKRLEYAAFGIPSYWIINPLADKVGLIEFRLEHGHYHEVAEAYGEEVFETDFPFPIKLVPHWLTASGAWRKHIGGGSEEAQAVQR